MDDENFDPGARAAATQGLRGAYDSGDYSNGGGDFGDTSWLESGYGITRKNDYSIDDLASLYDLTGKEATTDNWGLGMQNANKPAELSWLPGNKFFNRNDFEIGEDGKYSGYKGDLKG